MCDKCCLAAMNAAEKQYPSKKTAMQEEKK